jgi:3-hydroxyisobutyrate dehydrogenase-like beta-hydroxyacid dehydrogenase
MSTVTIIGTGNMARSVAVRALAGGYRVQLLGHTSERPNNWQRT